MTDLNKRQRYALACRRGYSDREAAEQAGYAGRPGPDARRLRQLIAKEARDDHESLNRKLTALQDQVGRGSADAYREAKLDGARNMAEKLTRDIELRLEAVEALREEQSQRDNPRDDGRSHPGRRKERAHSG